MSSSGHLKKPHKNGHCSTVLLVFKAGPNFAYVFIEVFIEVDFSILNMIYIKYDIWTVSEVKWVTKSFAKLPRDILLKYKSWVEVITIGGPSNLRNYPSFRDERLKGSLKMCRASRLNRKYRVLYLEEEEQKEIIVLKITAHEYKD